MALSTRVESCLSSGFRVSMNVDMSGGVVGGDNGIAGVLTGLLKLVHGAGSHVFFANIDTDFLTAFE